MSPVSMHQTTVRFGPDLWAAIEAEAARLGVSAAQYVRDATLVRLTYSRGRGDMSAPAWTEQRRSELETRVFEELDSAAAVREQGALARSRAVRARAEARRMREEKERLRR